MANIFIDSNSRKKISFFVAEYNGDLYSGDSYKNIIEKISKSNPEDIQETIENNLKETDLEKIEVSFLVPDFAISSLIWERSLRIDNGQYILDISELTKTKLVILLKEWNIKKDGEPLPATSEYFGILHPVVFQGIIDKMNENIQLINFM